MPIIFSPFPPDKIRKISEAIEKKIKQTKSEIVALLGICLLSISLTTFLLSLNEIAGMGQVRGYELVVQYKLVTARIFALLHFLGLLILAIPKFPDKFRYATLFTFINIPLVLIIYLYEVPRRISGFPDSAHSGNLSLISFFILLVCWILFGLETYKTQSKNPLFIFFASLNNKIQYFFDEYAGLDWKEAIREFKTRHKK